MLVLRRDARLKPVNIALLGLGVVGSSTINVLQQNQSEIARRLGRGINIFGVCAKDRDKPRSCDLSNIPFLDADELVAHPDIDIVVELIGGSGVAKELTLKAIDANKHVVTANKALIAEHGNEIFAKASARDRIINFEAAVAGGIPIIKTIREGLGGNQIQSCVGIINGTCNYILTKMRNEKCSFEQALNQAQSLGFAEMDSRFDVDGIDSAHKLTILASIAFGIPLQFDKVYKQGIRHISNLDVEYASELGYEIKSLGIAKHHRNGIELRVEPVLVPRTSMLAGVEGAMNAVLVHANAVGPTLYYGQGAGGQPTASAVVADIVEVVRMLSTPDARVPYLAFQDESIANQRLLDIDDFVCGSYLRILLEDKPGALAAITQILSQAGISIQTVVQKACKPKQTGVDVVLLTHPCRWALVAEAMSTINALPGTLEPMTCIHIEPGETTA
jgi:homoserine dehydrogenase